MTLPHFLVAISALISIFGSLAYIRDTLKGKTKPNRVTWSMWALAPLLATGAALSAQADIWTTFRIFLAGFLPLIVFITSFLNKSSYWKMTTFDRLCGLCSIVAIVLWAILNSPRAAILFFAIADGCAALPTLIKAWKFPETETGAAYIAGLIAVLLVLPSIPVWNIENAAFQIYLLLANACIIFAVYRKKWLRFA